MTGIIVLILVPTLLVITIVVLGAVVSAGIFAVQAVTGTARVGTVIGVRETTVRGRRGFNERYCSGYLQLGDGRPPVRVRVYSEQPCDAAVGQPASLVPGVLAPVTRLWASDDLGEPMPFSGALGTADGALAGSAWALLTENGVFTVLTVLVLATNTFLIVAWRKGSRIRRNRKSLG
jgi:hypothetical protein